MKRLINITLSVFLITLLVTTANAQVVTFNKTYGQMPYNYGKRIIQAADRGYYILANENGNIANTNIHIIRTDSLGVILYEKTIGDASVYSANDFIRTSDKGLLITGLTNKHPQNGYDVLLVKTDSNANVQWEKTYGGSDWDMANSVIETPDHAYLIAGQTYSYGPEAGNIYIIKTNFNGDTLWTRVYGGDSTDYATSIDIRFNSTYLIGGATNSFGHGNYDGYVLNLTQGGDTLWSKTYGEDKEDIINSIKQTQDSGFVFVGSTMSYNASEHEFWLMRFDMAGNYVWKLPEFWDIGSADDIANNVTIDDSGRFIIIGYTNGAGNGGYELSVLIMEDNHNFICSHTDGSTEDDFGNYAMQTHDGGYAIIGSSEGLGIGISNIYLVKMAGNCSYSFTTEQILSTEHITTDTSNALFGIFPSISDGKYVLRFRHNNSNDNLNVIVTNLVGQTIYSENTNPNNTSEYLIDISNEAAGLYFITVSNNLNRYCLKVIKQ